MGAIASFKQVALGLGLAVGLAQAASAQTYTGTYTGADNGNITISIDGNGAVTCNLSSNTGMGNYSGKGGVLRQKPTMVFTCDHHDFPNYLSVSGNNVQTGDDGLEGTYTMAANVNSDIKQGGFTVKRSNGGGVTTGQLTPAAISGLWYDPASNGTGFNFIAADNGFFATYYGRSAGGQPLWLISTEVPAGALKTGTQYTTILGATTAGTFSQPAFQVETWGKLDITFSSCTRATATLSGKDGTQRLNLQRLTNIGGVSGC